MAQAADKQRYLQAMGVDVWLPREPIQSAAHAPTRNDDNLESAAPTLDNPVAVPISSADETATAELSWDALAARVAICTACSLHKTRTQTVFGVGNRQAEWMIIGESPGAEEDRQGEPFVGRGGQLLDNMLRAVGLDRETVFIANILKCHPPGNRDPQPEETAHCTGYLQRQIALVKPRLIVAVGRVAAQYLLNSDTPIGRLRGQRHDYLGIPLVVTYHPAYLLRSPQEKRKVWQDLQLARQVSHETVSAGT